MALPHEQIRRARAMLQEHGLIETITPRQLVKASNELDKGLKEALEEISHMFAEREGTA